MQKNNLLQILVSLSLCFSLSLPYSFAGDAKDIASAVSTFSSISTEQVGWKQFNGNDAPREEIYELLKKTYMPIGLPHQSADELKEYSHILAAYEKATGKIVAYAAFKETPFGLKLGNLGSNSVPPGKDVIVKMLGMMGNTLGVYAELSSAAAAVAIKSNPHVVPFNEVRRVLKKKVERPAADKMDEIFSPPAPRKPELPNLESVRKNCYKRILLLNGEPKVTHKVMIGYPVDYGGDEKGAVDKAIRMINSPTDTIAPSGCSHE